MKVRSDVQVGFERGIYAGNTFGVQEHRSSSCPRKIEKHSLYVSQNESSKSLTGTECLNEKFGTTPLCEVSPLKKRAIPKVVGFYLDMKIGALENHAFDEREGVVLS